MADRENKLKAKRGAPPKPATIAKVVQGKWTAKQLAAITFLANPRGGTQEELAAELKVDRHTIGEWKKLDGFMEDVHRVAAVYFLEADLQVDRANLRDAIMNPTQHPDVAASILKARELYYKRRGLLVEKREYAGEVGIKDSRLSTLMEDANDKELRAIIAAGAGGVGSNGADGEGEAERD